MAFCIPQLTTRGLSLEIQKRKFKSKGSLLYSERSYGQIDTVNFDFFASYLTQAHLKRNEIIIVIVLTNISRI